MSLKFVHLFCVLLIVNLVNARLDLSVPTPAFDQELYQNVLDPELCSAQLNSIVEEHPILWAKFLDAGYRTPRGILGGNFVDLGNYFQCLSINQDVGSSVVEGKYCMINVPSNQAINLPNIPEIPWPFPENPESYENERRLQEFYVMQRNARALVGDNENISVNRNSSVSIIDFKLALCIPKPCTTRQAIDFLLINSTAAGIEFTDSFCRLPNDKPWSPADYVFAIFFGLIGILTVLSTCYDVRRIVFLGMDPNTSVTLYRSFSIYTNARRIMTFTSRPGALECLDGIRSFAMIWVILGHTFTTQLTGLIGNPLEALDDLMQSPKYLFATASLITVDTFFMISGLLLVYSTAGKMTSMKLLKNLHLFYLNRILRMFPLLAVGVLLQASMYHRIADGPNWEFMATKTERCRTYWWTTLLYVNNYLNPTQLCLSHSWYLAVDFHCYVVSPLVLFWVLSGKKLSAWTALISSVLITVAVGATLSYINNFPGSPLGLANAPAGYSDYMTHYYFNTLTRASPFFVGMAWGYVIHLHKNKKVKIPWAIATISWILAVGIGSLVIYSHYPVMSEGWDNQVVNNLVNSFMRPVWAVIIGWMVFACQHGYAGPINWILSLRVWKLPSRLSYAMYVLHYSLIYVVNSTVITPNYFTLNNSLFKFLGNLTLTFIVAYLVSVFVDSPCGVLITMIFGGGQKRPKTEKESSVQEKINNDKMKTAM